MPATTYQEGDGYVTCDECGHAIEAHTTRGCGRCDCGSEWTRDAIRAERQEAGLPGYFYRPNF